MPTAAIAHSIPFFPYPQAFLSEEDDLMAIFRDVGRRGAFILQRDVRHFEENLARFLAARHAIGVGNATDGLLIALRAAGFAPDRLEAGSEVIFSSHTMVATAAAIHFAGAIPVPVECGADHLIDPAAVEAAITPRTRAILPTQLNGRTADMDALERIRARHGLILIEDAAQALGARFRGRCAGTFGAAAAISFFPAKLLGCLGDGGAVITDDHAMAARVEALHDHGRGADGEIRGWGLNSRLDNLQAAILDYRLQKYGAVIERRRALARAYRDQLGSVEEIVLPPGPDDDPDHFDVYQNYEIEAGRRDGLRAFLEARGIGTLVPWGGKAVHQWDALGLSASLPRTEKLLERVLLLPMHAWLVEDEIAAIAGTVKEFYRARG
jgi:dTDP-4-amino-4,6-dideoxygalactose transaminase